MDEIVWSSLWINRYSLKRGKFTSYQKLSWLRFIMIWCGTRRGLSRSEWWVEHSWATIGCCGSDWFVSFLLFVLHNYCVLFVIRSRAQVLILSNIFSSNLLKLRPLKLLIHLKTTWWINVNLSEARFFFRHWRILINVAFQFFETNFDLLHLISAIFWRIRWWFWHFLWFSFFEYLSRRFTRWALVDILVT